MALATSKYDVTLNGQGFLLVEESYKERAQQAWTARFATGDPGYGDLSFWQFMGMKAFTGGQGQDIFSAITKIRGSVGWDLSDGKPRLSLGKGVYGSRNGTNPSAPNAPVDFGSSAGSVHKQRQKTVRWGCTTTNDVLTLISPGSAASAVQLDRVAIASTECTFYQTSAKDGAVWHRPKMGSWLMTCNGANLYAYSVTTGANPVAPSYTVALGTVTDAIAIVPINGNTIAILAQGTAVGNPASITVLTLNNNLWTIATELCTTFANPGAMVYGVSAVDSNGMVYFLNLPYILDTNVQPNLDSRVYAFSAADLLDTNGPRCTVVYELNNMVAAGLCALGGVVYALGALRKSGSTQQQAIIQVSNQTTIWESPHNYLSSDGDNIITQYFQENPSEVFFLGRNYLLNYDSLYRMRVGGQIDEVWALPKAADGTVDNYNPSFCANRYYYVGRAAAKIYSSLDVRGALDSSGTEAILETSELTGDTNLIQKSPYSVLIEISEAMSGTDVLTVKINDTTIGTMALADGTRKEITVPSDLTASGFKIKVVAARAVVWNGYLKGLFLKYVPTQFKKKQWGFTVRATNNLKLIDGERELSSSATLFAAIKTAWASNIPVTFVDIDGVSHSVLVTDYDRRTPLIDRKGGSKIEQLCTVECLEV